MSWNTCDPVLRRLGLQLPTESQWEYAARGGTTTQFWNGDDRESLRGNANIADASLGEVNTNPLDWVWREYDDGYPLHAPVHTLAPNPFGLHHVTGNVGEWCYDWYAFYRYPLLHGDGQQVTSSDDRRGRVFRPGNWSDLWLFARSSVRHSIGPEA